MYLTLIFLHSHTSPHSPSSPTALSTSQSLQAVVILLPGPIGFENPFLDSMKSKYGCVVVRSFFIFSLLWCSYFYFIFIIVQMLLTIITLSFFLKFFLTQSFVSKKSSFSIFLILFHIILIFFLFWNQMGPRSFRISICQWRMSLLR